MVVSGRLYLSISDNTVTNHICHLQESPVPPDVLHELDLAARPYHSGNIKPIIIAITIGTFLPAGQM